MTPEIAAPFQTLLTLSFKAAVLVVAILLLRVLLGHRLSPAWRHALWGVVPLQLLFCMSVPSPWSVQNLWTKNAELAIVVPAENDMTIPTSSPREAELMKYSGWEGISPSFETTTPHPSPLPRERGMPNEVVKTSGFDVTLPSFTQVVVAVWLSGCVVMALVFLRQTLLCQRWMRQAEQVESEAVLRIFKDCARRMKVRTWLVIAESRSVTGPLLIGTIRPTLLLPHGLVESATPGQLRTVLLHELAHLKRWDVWTGWLMTVLLTLHWFNPLLWLAVRKMNADREEAADELALRTMEPVERPDYGRALIDIAQHFVTPTRTPGLVGISETGKNLTRRIEMLNHTESWKMRWKILAVFAVLLLGVTTMTDAQTHSPAEIQAEIDRLKGELVEAKKAEKTVTPPSTVNENLPKNFPLLKFLGEFAGMEGDDPIRFQFILTVVPKGNADFDRLDGKAFVSEADGTTYKVSDSLMVFIHEGGLSEDKNKKQDDSYIGKLLYVGPNELELRVEKYFDDNVREKPVPKALKSMPVKVIGEGKNMVLEIPKNAEWDKIRLERVKKDLPTAPLHPTAADTPTGLYLGYEGDDRIGIEIGVPKGGVFPITIYEDGLPGKGYDPNDDDKYVGTAATFGTGHPDRIGLRIKLTQRFDGPKRKPVEEALQELTAKIEKSYEDNGVVLHLTIPKNREWDAVKVTKEVPLSPWLEMQDKKPSAKLLDDYQKFTTKIPGSYLGYEGDDRIGLVLGEAKDGVFPVTVYEDGLPGKGFDPNDDDRYEGTAMLKDGKLEITLTKKFDENIEEPVEKELRKLTATISVADGKSVITVPKNREWDAVRVTKVPVP